MLIAFRLFAPSSVRPLVAVVSLMITLLLFPHCACAGTYTWTTTDPNTGEVTAKSPLYSGGNVVFTYNSGQAYTYSYSYDPYPGGSFGWGNPFDEGGTDALCSGAITAVFTWQPDSGQTLATDPPPDSVIVEQTCDARVNGSNYTTTPVVGDCDNGLGTSQPTLTQTQTYWGATIGTADCNSTSYVVRAGGPTVTLTCSPRAHCQCNVTQVDVRYSANVFPITINLTGTTPDSSGGLNVLTGGQVTATLNCPYPVTSYSWSVSGATAPNPFLTWDPTFPNSNYPTQFVALTSIDMASDSFSFYDAHNGDDITVQCTATVQPPSGPALTVTAKSPDVTYMKPSVNWVVNHSYGSRPFGFFDGLPSGPFGSQELWGPITITEPPLFVTPGNVNTVGLGVIVQIANLNRSNTRVPINGKPATYSKISILYANGTGSAIAAPIGLDGNFPYPYGAYKNTDGTFTDEAGNYGWLAYSDGYSGDRPTKSYRNSDQDGGGDAWNAASASDSFDTWVMYRPASVGGQGTIYVPLQKLSWSWGGMASLDQYNLWNVSQSQPFVSGPPASTEIYPSWNLKLPQGLNIGP